MIVDGIFSTAPNVLFTAFGTPAPAVAVPGNQGSPGVPVPLTVNTLDNNGQVDFGGISYYAADGLTAGSRYAVSINGLTNNATLTVYNNDGTFTAPATCLINNISFTGTTPEDCTLTASGGTLYFTVTANTAGGGAAFITLIKPGP